MNTLPLVVTFEPVTNVASPAHQEPDDACDLVGIAQPPNRDLPLDLCESIFRHGIKRVRCDVAGRDSIHLCSLHSSVLGRRLGFVGTTASSLANALGLIAPTIEKAVDRTGQAHFLEPLAERLTPPVEPDRDVVERGAEAGGDPITRLAKNVGAPDDVSILGLERR